MAIWIIHRAAKLFDRVIVAVAKNEGKKPLFSLKERLAWCNSRCDLPKVEADSFDTLLVNYVENRRARPSSAACARCRILNLNFNSP
jgi:pantetheine-phosphate adenylyltransferase